MAARTRRRGGRAPPNAPIGTSESGLAARRRLRVLCDHHRRLPPPPPQPARRAAATAAHPQQQLQHAAGSSSSLPPRPLTAAQTAEFNARGFLVLPVPELSAEWRAAFYDAMDAERRRAAALDRESGWPADVAHRSPNFARPVQVCGGETSER